MINDIDWIKDARPASDRQIDAAELHFGHKFPADYREFAKRFAGGEPLRTDFTFHDGETNFNGGIGIFLNFERSDDYNLISTAKMTEDLPHGVIPIAEGGGGDYVALDYRKGEEPKVVFWNHGRRGQLNETSFISNTFEEFIDMLKEPED